MRWGARCNILLHAADADICQWVSRQLFGEDDAFDEKSRAIGVIYGEELIAGVIYNNYVPGITIEMSIASIDNRWATRHNLRAFFTYPFIKLGLERVQTLCSATEGDIVAFNKRLGFVEEGYHRKAWHTGGDAISFGMLKDECKWIRGGGSHG